MKSTKDRRLILTSFDNKVSWAFVTLSGLASTITARHALSPPSPSQPNFLLNRCVQSFTGVKAHGAYTVPDMAIALWKRPFDISDIM